MFNKATKQSKALHLVNWYYKFSICCRKLYAYSEFGMLYAHQINFMKRLRIVAQRIQVTREGTFHLFVINRTLKIKLKEVVIENCWMFV